MLKRKSYATVDCPKRLLRLTVQTLLKRSNTGSGQLLRVAFFYPLPLGLQQPQAVPWAQEYVVYMYGSDAANGTGAKFNGHC